MSYKEVTCPTCDGRGWVLPEQNINEEPAETVEKLKCPECEGGRTVFVSPLWLKERER